jgi:hypothetical protein
MKPPLLIFGRLIITIILIKSNAGGERKIPNAFQRLENSILLREVTERRDYYVAEDL